MQPSSPPTPQSIAASVFDFNACAVLAQVRLGGGVAGGDRATPPAVCKRVPMLLARRMSAGSKLAVEAALMLTEQCVPDAAVFVSRHAELPHLTRNLERRFRGEPFSPADFSASVHNAASGVFTIVSGLKIPVSSVAAGSGSAPVGSEFSPAVEAEAAAFFAAGYKTVLVVFFENELPAVYREVLADDANHAAWAEAWLLAAPAAAPAPPAQKGGAQ